MICLLGVFGSIALLRESVWKEVFLGVSCVLGIKGIHYYIS